MRPIASAPAAARPTELHMRIVSDTGLRGLKQVLTTPAAQGCRITLHALLGDGNAAVITLPERYDVSADIFNRLQNFEGMQVLAG